MPPFIGFNKPLAYGRMMQDKTAQRLDIYVAGRLPALSRAAAAKLIERGKVSVNRAPKTKAGYRLKESDEVSIDYEQTQSSNRQIKLEVIYEDNDCLVINKPANILTHSKGAFNPEATVATWLNQLAPEMTGDRAGIVHRLDRATSGVMIVAKTPAALTWLQKQFSQRKVKKTYVAIVEGELEPKQAIIDIPIERNPKKPQTFRVGSNGKTAKTTYKVLKSTNGLSLVEFTPETGRTHQLRVHASHLKHPILGDSLYGGKQADRLFLHAKELEITMPSRERKVFSAPLPTAYRKVMAT